MQVIMETQLIILFEVFSNSPNWNFGIQSSTSVNHSEPVSGASDWRAGSLVSLPLLTLDPATGSAHLHSSHILYQLAIP